MRRAQSALDRAKNVRKVRHPGQISAAAACFERAAACAGRAGSRPETHENAHEQSDNFEKVAFLCHFATLPRV